MVSKFYLVNLKLKILYTKNIDTHFTVYEVYNETAVFDKTSL